MKHDAKGRHVVEIRNPKSEIRNRSDEPPGLSRPCLVWLGLISLACHVGVAVLSFRFVVGDVEGYRHRPILPVLGLLAVAFACYLALSWQLFRRESPSPNSKSGSLLWVLLFAVAFRFVHLLGEPIQEIDIYRYLWDGQVAAAGVNPYRYSPNEAAREAGYRIVEIQNPNPEIPNREWVWVSGRRSPDGDRLMTLLSQPAAFEIFWTVDHRDVRTIYPPAAQAVFALAAQLTPDDLGVRGHIRLMKGILLLFDLGVIGLLILLLRAAEKPPEWCVAYAWCPLVLKEVANSGHLDVIAVFFTVLIAYLLISDFGFRISDLVKSEVRIPKSEIRAGRLGLLAGLAYAAAILAKVYPLVLLPVMVRRLWDLGRWRAVLTALGTSAAVLIAAYALVWPSRVQDSKREEVETRSPFSGLQVFVAEWEMNDLIFNKVYLGLDRLLGDESQEEIVRFFGDSWPRRVATADAAEQLAVPPAYLLAYLVNGLALGLFTIWLATRRTPGWFLEGLFYSLAVPFLLSPTANPWYLMWAVPFLPWARQFAWFVLTGLVLQYYLRFWFLYHFPEASSVWGTNLDGREFFNEVWTWVEYLPFYVLLMVELVRRKGSGRRKAAGSGELQ